MEAQIGTTQMLFWRTPRIRSFAAFLALAIVVVGGSSFVTRDAGATRIAFCATASDPPGEPLNVSVMQQHPDAPLILRTSETDAGGCGEFSTVPPGRPVMIVVWTDDGFSTGSTGWIDPVKVSGTLPIQLESQMSPLAG